ncbi:hypothetical protein QQF64_013208 [Cirrhinus molitorella]|uniref:C-type lectin domain-containing protein n=1 Tax=Cirrhinus molitorella TaxID=172907 RepID=A0ABR3LU43_9TELE
MSLRYGSIKKSTDAHRRSGTVSDNSITGFSATQTLNLHIFYQVNKMDSVYENIDYMPPSTALDVRCSLYSDVNTLADLKSAQEKNTTMIKLEELITNYTRVKTLSIGVVQSCNLSVDGWIACHGKLYLFSTDKLNWSSSRDVCVSKGADLVTITNQTEQDFLVSKIKQTHWIGLNDLETEGQWVWVNNQTLNETGAQFWFSEGPTEPDNWRNQDPSGENCAISIFVIQTLNFITSYLYNNETLCDFLILNNLKQNSSHIRHLFCQVHKMDSIYENSGIILSTIASAENPSQCKDNSTEEQESERAVTSPKWTTVLLIVLGFSLVLALGGLCALGMLYNKKIVDFESLNEKHIIISKQLSAQEINITILTRELEEFKANYTRVKELSPLHNVMKKEFNDLTARYNTLRKWLSFYDAQSCNLSVDGWIACRGKLYLFNSDKQNWSRSRDVCLSKEADLVTITSQTEQDFLASKIKQTHWIGLNDLEIEGHWVWVNNQTLKENEVQFWFDEGQREPDNWRNQDPSGENCASLGDENGSFQSWFDASCKKTKKFICEKKY